MIISTGVSHALPGGPGGAGGYLEARAIRVVFFQQDRINWQIRVAGGGQVLSGVVKHWAGCKNILVRIIDVIFHILS